MMRAIEAFFQKWVLVLFWIALGIHCLFQYTLSPYVAVTKPMLVPFLLTFLLLNDNNIGNPWGKFIFYVGLFLALFGDVLLISINDTFFLSGMIIFMMMNLCYSLAFLHLNPLRRATILPLVSVLVLLCMAGYGICYFLGNSMGSYKVPIIVYMCTVSIMVLLAVNIASSDRYRAVALIYFIPGAFIFLAENTLIALNRFHYNSNKDVYVLVMITYGLAQYLFVKGIQKAYIDGADKNAVS